MPRVIQRQGKKIIEMPPLIGRDQPIRDSGHDDELSLARLQ
jgi:hypothetical protein